MPSLSSSIPVQLEVNPPDVRIKWVTLIDSVSLEMTANLGALA
jgi:hypothetical protein